MVTCSLSKNQQTRKIMAMSTEQMSNYHNYRGHCTCSSEATIVRFKKKEKKQLLYAPKKKEEKEATIVAQ